MPGSLDLSTCLDRRERERRVPRACRCPRVADPSHPHTARAHIALCAPTTEHRARRLDPRARPPGSLRSQKGLCVHV